MLHVSQSITIQSIRGIEQLENSRVFSLKGYLDIVVSADLEIDGRVYPATPLVIELKTGKSTKFSYNAQVIMYQLMLLEKHEIKHRYLGILFYLKLNQIEFINLRQNEVHDILMKRNQLAIMTETHQNSPYYDLPPLIDRPFECNNCSF